MMGAQRRIEARIGQLLGDGHEKQLTGKPYTHECKGIPRQDRNVFRRLARGLGVLTDEEWRQSRRGLVNFLNARYPVARHQPEVVVQKDGITK